MGASVTLAEFLAEAARDRGAWNCSTMPADWAIAKGWPDFAAPWRDITDDAECETVAGQAGGLVELWREGIGDALPVAQEPYEPGDIAVLHLHKAEAGAIWTGERWALKGKRSIVIARVAPENVVAAWRVPHNG